MRLSISILRRIYPALPAFTERSAVALARFSNQQWAQYRLDEWQFQEAARRRERVHCVGIVIGTLALAGLAIFGWAIH